MGSLFRSTRNTRFVPGSDHRLIRSDVPVHLAADEIEWLLRQEIQTVIDLRAPEEQAQKPCCLIDRPEFRYLSLPVSGGNVVPATPDEVSRSYIAMCDVRMDQIVKTILDSKTGVLYFCNAGKDRTGVVTALLMRQLGCTDREIVDDYLLSKENLEPMLTAYAAANPDVSLQVIAPCARYMREFLDWGRGAVLRAAEEGYGGE